MLTIRITPTLPTKPPLPTLPTSLPQVLQLVIATVDDHIEPNGNNLWDTLLTGVTATAVSGFMLACFMMFSFRQMADLLFLLYVLYVPYVLHVLLDLL